MSSFTNEVWLAVWNPPDGTGDGSPGNPWAVNTPSLFATIMNTRVGPNSIIRLMPGLFRTRGANGEGYGLPGGLIWQPRSGQRIVGSGINSTILQFSWDTSDTNNLFPNPSPGQRHYIMTSSDFLHSFELSDLTIDCNMQSSNCFDPAVIASGGVTASVVGGATTLATSVDFFTGSASAWINKVIVVSGVSPVFSARITNVIDLRHVAIDGPPDHDITTKPFTVYGMRFSVTALSVTGDNVLIRRVRVINFGTRTPYKIDGQDASDYATDEGFPLIIGGRSASTPSFNSVVEDCILEQPNPWPAREVTSCVLKGILPVNPAAKLHLQPTGLVLRNCYFNFDFVNEPPGIPGPISSLSRLPSPPYTVTVNTVYPHNVLVGDFIEMDGNAPATFNGRFLVTSVSTSDGTSRQLTFTPPSDPGVPAGVGFLWKSAKPTCQVTLSRPNPVTDKRRVSVNTTPVKHNRQSGDWVVITGVTPDAGPFPDVFIGTFAVNSRVDDYNFDYLTETDPSADPSGDAWLDRRPNGFVSVSGVRPFSSPVNSAEIACRDNHYRRVGDWIALDGIVTSGTNNSFNNYVQVAAVQSKTVLICTLPGNLNVGPLDPPTRIPQGGDAGFGSNFQAVSNNGGYGGGSFSNRIVGANRGFYHDTWQEEQFIARRNYLYDNYVGLLMVLAGSTEMGQGLSSSFFDANAATAGDGTVTVTLTTAGVDPGWRPGLAICLSVGTLVYSVQIQTARSPATSADFAWFTCKLPASSSGISGSVIADIWTQQTSIVFEDNIVDLRLAPKGGVGAGPRGIEFGVTYYTDDPLPPIDGTFGGMGWHPFLNSHSHRLRESRSASAKFAEYRRPRTRSGNAAEKCQRRPRSLVSQDFVQGGPIGLQISEGVVQRNASLRQK